MLRDFRIAHRHPDFRMPEGLLQNRDIGPGQNGFEWQMCDADCRGPWPRAIPSRRRRDRIFDGVSEDLLG
jgi:hypothetical protein